MHERDGFAAEAVGKSLFHCQNAAPAMVWPASSDFSLESALRIHSCANLVQVFTSGRKSDY